MSAWRYQNDLYPRPDFVRTNLHWRSLNGTWDFLFDDEDIGLSQSWYLHALPDQAPSKESNTLNKKRTIQVAFVFQSKASGINDQGAHEVLWYERTLTEIRTHHQRQSGERLLLRFGAVDYSAQVWLNGISVGSHRGGHVPFDLDLTDAIASHAHSSEYRLTVRVFDSASDTSQPRGKQFWGPVPESIWYTPSSGIWQTVWLEGVPRLRIGDSSSGTILRSHDIDGGALDARMAFTGRRTREACSVMVEVSLAGVAVGSSGLRELPPDEDFVRLGADMRLSEKQFRQLPQDFLQDIPRDDRACWRNGVALWSPEHPTLYDITIRLFNQTDELLDEVKTTAGMRSLNWTKGDGTVRLNDQPYFQALLLDQGYWPDTLLTPRAQESLKQDIQLSKAMGFNGCRKHQKVEDPVFLYWADKLGFLVWGEMASCHRFSVDAVDRFDQEWMEAMRRDINHPCIVTWTPANESWGYPDLGSSIRQRDHLRSLYHKTKTLDWTRPINDNCGWEHVATDLTTFHDYSDADGMAKRCASVQTVLSTPPPSGHEIFVKSYHGPGGAYDKGSEHQRGAPILCTELGGVNVASVDDPSQRTNWGYTTASDSKTLLKKVEDMIMATVKSGVVCGIVWTQL